MRRVVITAIGICSPLGNNADDVRDSLRSGKSGITASAIFAERGFSSQIGAFVKDLPVVPVDRMIQRGFGDGNLLRFAYYAMYQAVQDSGLTQEQLHAAGIIVGNGGPSTPDQVNAANKTLKWGKPRVSPLTVIPVMTSGPVAVLATAFQIREFNYMVGAACATGTIAIGEAVQKIRLGEADVVFAGGAESADWEEALGFDVGAMCGDSNDNPTRGSRPYDATRKGFVIGEGAAIVVVEELEHAKARGARIYAEVTGYGLSSDGNHLTDPNLDGAVRCIRKTLRGFDGRAIRPAAVGYANTHGTSTPNGDTNELRAIHAVFGNDAPLFSSTKSMSGHSLGAAGAQEAVYCLLMMDDGFIAPNINVTEPDPLLDELGLLPKLVRTTREEDVSTVMSINFGFGGVNAGLMFEKYAA